MTKQEWIAANQDAIAMLAAGKAAVVPILSPDDANCTLKNLYYHDDIGLGSINSLYNWRLDKPVEKAHDR